MHIEFPLPAANTDRGTVLFSGTDSAVLFQHNLRSQGPEWPWRSRPVEYHLNSLGYRAPEFDSVSWSDCVVLLGCSWAFGVGVSEDHTLSHYLSRELGCPVINLSQGGTSIRWSVDQLTLLLAAGHRPHSVVSVWTETTRWPYYGSPGSDHDVRSQALFTAHAVDEQHSDARAWLDVTSVRVMCLALGIPLVEATWSSHTADVLAVTQLQSLDWARDGSHPGPQSHRAAAKILSLLF
jgi:hypothetical protein